MTTHQIRMAGVMSLLGISLVVLTRLVRPELSGFPQWMVFIFGILPNFGAGLWLPFVLLVTAHRLLRPETFRTKLSFYFLLALGLAFSGLAAWEAVQYYLWGYPMDPYDLMATGIGVLCASVGWVFSSLNLTRKESSR